MALHRSKLLKKDLRLFDVYVIATGAMFSSGFFLLPGIAYAGTGASVILAYLLSGLLIVPAMLSQAELAKRLKVNPRTIARWETKERIPETIRLALMELRDEYIANR